MTGDDTIEVEYLMATRVFGQNNGDADVVLRMTGSVNGDRNFIIDREDFVRFVDALVEDARRLSTMPLSPMQC